MFLARHFYLQSKNEVDKTDAPNDFHKFYNVLQMYMYVGIYVWQKYFFLTFTAKRK